MANKLNTKEKLLILKYNNLHNRITCPSCESTILRYDNYCFKCGAKVVNKDEKTEIKKQSDKTHDTDRKQVNEKISSHKNLINPDNNNNFTEYLRYFDYNNIQLTKLNITNEIKYSTYILLILLNNNPIPLHENEIILQKYNVNPEDLIRYMLTEKLVVINNGKEIYEYCLGKCENEDIYHIISENNLLLYESKSDNIYNILNNVSKEFLKNYFDMNVYTLTDNAIDYLKDNKHMIYYHNFLNNIDIDDYESYYQHNYSDMRVFLKSITNVFKEIYSQKKLWDDYATIQIRTAQINEYYQDYTEMLRNIIDYYIYTINPYRNNGLVSDNKHLLTPEVKELITYSIAKANLTYDEFTKLIHETIKNYKNPNIVDEKILEEILIDILKNELLNKINYKIEKSYDLKQMNENVPL